MSKREFDRKRYKSPHSMAQHLKRKYLDEEDLEINPDDAQRAEVKKVLTFYGDSLMSPDGRHVSLEEFLAVLGNRTKIWALTESGSTNYLERMDLLNQPLERQDIIGLFTREGMIRKYLKNLKQKDEGIQNAV